MFTEFFKQIRIIQIKTKGGSQKIFIIMERQNIFTGIKLLSRNLEDPLVFTHNQSNYISNPFFSIKQNTVIFRSSQNLKLFNLDCCLTKNSTQQQIYDNFCLVMAEDFVQGYDCTFIVCGQSNSNNGFNQIIIGKDSQQMKGLIPRFIDQISNSIRYFSSRKFLFKVSFLEINNEQMIDLLGIKKCKLQIKEQKVNKNQFYVNNLQIKQLRSIDEIQSFYLVGSRKREYAYSKSYRKKQNSTVFFTIYLESIDEDTNSYRQSKFVCCELSQSCFQDYLSYPAQNRINKNHSIHLLQRITTELYKDFNLSNFAFQNVINTLVYGGQNAYIPIRDSKVTKILGSSLGGSHKTSILGTIYQQSQKELVKSQKILKTIQIAGQIQNNPTNIKQFQTQKSNLISLLKKSDQLLNQLKKYQTDLSILLNSTEYIQNQIDEIKKKNGHSLVKENQFCSQKNLQGFLLQEKTKKQWQLKQKIRQTQKKIKEISSYIQNQKVTQIDHIQSKQKLVNHEQVITKRKQILLRIKSVKEKRLNLITKKLTQPHERQKKKQIFNLQIQFQKQRSLFTDKIRKLQEQLSFYKKVAENSLKKEEISIIRNTSKYEQTKRQFQIPFFVIQNKKIKPIHMISPSISQRKFMISPNSSRFNSSNHSISLQKKSIRSIRSGSKSFNKMAIYSPKKLQALQNIKSDYHVESQTSQRLLKKIRQLPKIQSQKQQKSEQIRAKIQKDPNRSTKYNTLIKRVKSSENINMIRSEYLIEGVNLNRLIQYNQNRKILKLKQKQPSFFINKSLKKPFKFDQKTKNQSEQF